jgi:predicted kinase
MTNEEYNDKRQTLRWLKEQVTQEAVKGESDVMHAEHARDLEAELYRELCERCKREAETCPGMQPA